MFIERTVISDAMMKPSSPQWKRGCTMEKLIENKRFSKAYGKSAIPAYVDMVLREADHRSCSVLTKQRQRLA